MLSQKTLIRLAPWLDILFCAILWEDIVVGLNVPEFLFPSLSAVWKATLTHWDPIMMHATQTFLTTMAGFGIAVVFGLALGAAVVGSKTGGPDYLKQFVEPICVTENTLRRGFAPQE